MNFGGTRLSALATGTLPGRRDGNGWRLNGDGLAEAGALVADRLLLVFYDAADAAYVATIPADAPGLRRKTTPETIGQRQSGGAVILATDLSVPIGAWAVLSDNMLAHLDALQQASRISLLVGTAEGALAEGRVYTLNKSRPWVHSGYGKHVDDPFVQRRYGDLHIRARAAAALADAAIARFEAAIQSGGRPDADLLATLDTAELWAAQVALAAGSGIFEVMGARSATKENGYDRFWRNARTVTLRHPIEPRAIAIGDWLLSQSASPPPSERHL